MLTRYLSIAMLYTAPISYLFRTWHTSTQKATCWAVYSLSLTLKALTVSIHSMVNLSLKQLVLAGPIYLYIITILSLNLFFFVMKHHAGSQPNWWGQLLRIPSLTGVLFWIYTTETHISSKYKSVIICEVWKAMISIITIILTIRTSTVCPVYIIARLSLQVYGD